MAQPHFRRIKELMNDCIFQYVCAHPDVSIAQVLEGVEEAKEDVPVIYQSALDELDYELEEDV